MTRAPAPVYAAEPEPELDLYEYVLSDYEQTTDHKGYVGREIAERKGEEEEEEVLAHTAQK